MPNPPKQNTLGEEGARVVQAGGPVTTGQMKVIDCGLQHITTVCEELTRNGVALSCTSGDSQLGTLVRALQFRGNRGLNTYEGTAAGYMRMATRVKELKDTWDIYALKEDVTGPDGLLHRGVARYVLLGRRKDRPLSQPAQKELGSRLS